MKKIIMKNKSIDDYPIVLSAKEISEILQISKPTAYELMNHSYFPVIKIGRCKRVLRDEFFKWISE
ncbi:helix-turn-helix domain-containing protein [Bacillus haimaensis]|uniref:helix-turn-helix domain-containing protein n=1 Tax=Bacillus haimaensis TaxID=3160967 RepID=UPI003AA88701